MTRAGAIPARTGLYWLPDSVRFRDDLRQAREAGEPLERLERLVALAQHRLGFLETIQLDHALGQVPPGGAPGFTSIRVALLGSSTMDHLVPAIRIACLRRRLLVDIQVAPYGQYRQALLEPAPELVRFRPDFVLLSITSRDPSAGIALSASADEVDAALAPWIADLRAMWGRARDVLNASVIQQTFLDVTEPLFGSHEGMVPGAPSQVVTRMNEQLVTAAKADAVAVLDIARASARDGLDAWFDIPRWLQAKQEIAPAAAGLYGDLLARVIATARGQSRKCLVLDLDNTLWGGVVGDDGISGLLLGEGSGIGEAHLALQRYAKQLGERGVILAVCSKNDPEIAAAAFRDHPEMVLQPADIAAFVANWEDKAVNLERIATQLNIGIDSLVFVDDNPAERSRIRQSLPLVAVPELPLDAALYTRCLADAGYFETVSFTPEDLERGRQYAANASRQSLLDSSGSLDDFLRSLDMAVVWGPWTEVDLPRIAQLINKTNQFNPTTHRLAAHEVAAIAGDENSITLQFRLLDRFGDNGLVAAMIMRPIASHPDALEIDTWVMSCRVFGRQLEWEAMNIAVEQAQARGKRALRAAYIPTPKNGVVSELYPSLGFDPVPGADSTDVGSQWSLTLGKYLPRATQITRRSD